MPTFRAKLELELELEMELEMEPTGNNKIVCSLAGWQGRAGQDRTQVASFD